MIPGRFWSYHVYGHSYFACSLNICEWFIDQSYEWIVYSRSGCEYLQAYTDFNQYCSAFGWISSSITLFHERECYRVSWWLRNWTWSQEWLGRHLHSVFASHGAKPQYLWPLLLRGLTVLAEVNRKFLQPLLLQDLPLKMNIYTGDRKFLALQCVLFWSHELQWSSLCLYKPTPLILSRSPASSTYLS